MFRSFVIITFAMASPAVAQDDYMFQSPSGNIAYLIDGTAGFVRCDMGEMTVQSHPNRPADCDLDYGHAFGIGAHDARGEALCYGDTLVIPDLPVLDYGEAVSLGGLSCTSAKTGMRCVNAAGHGFDISKAAQRLF
jgi:hypothetical protein